MSTVYIYIYTLYTHVVYSSTNNKQNGVRWLFGCLGGGDDDEVVGRKWLAHTHTHTHIDESNIHTHIYIYMYACLSVYKYINNKTSVYLYKRVEDGKKRSRRGVVAWCVFYTNPQTKKKKKIDFWRAAFLFIILYIISNSEKYSLKFSLKKKKSKG